MSIAAVSCCPASRTHFSFFSVKTIRLMVERYRRGRNFYAGISTRRNTDPWSYSWTVTFSHTCRSGIDTRRGGRVPF